MSIHPVTIYHDLHYSWGFLNGSVMKNPPAMQGATGDVGSIPGLGRSPREGNGNPIQYSCLENPMDRRAWWAMVHGVAKSWTQLNDTPLVLRVCLGLNFSTLHCNWSQFFEEEIRSCLSCDRLLSQVKSRSHLSRTRGEENSKLCSEWQPALFADHSVGGWKKGTIWSPLDLPLLAWDHDLTSPGRQQGPGLPWWLRW